MKIPNLQPPIQEAYPIIAETMTGETVTLIDSPLIAPLTHLRTRCYVEQGNDTKGAFILGSILSHPDTHYAHSFCEELDFRLRERATDAGSPLATHFIEASGIKLGLRISTHMRGIFSTVRLSCVSDGWDILTHLGYTEEPKFTKVLEGMHQHYDLLNLLSRALIEYDQDRLQEPHYYNVPSMIAETEAQIEASLEIPEIRENARQYFQGFAGIDYIIEEILDMIALGTEGVLDDDAASARIPALMLYGESGVGKTEIARAVARALDAREEYVGFEDIQSMYVGEWAAKIARTFDRAFDADERIVLIFDEFDGLIGSGNPGTVANINAVLKQKLEQLRNYPEVFVVLTSNSLDKIDPAVIADKRVPLKLHIPLPSEEELKSIFAKILDVDIDSDASRLRDIDLDGTDLIDALRVAKYDLSALAKEAEGFSPGDIRELIERAKRRQLTRHGRQASDISQEAIISAIRFARKHRPQAL